MLARLRYSNIFIYTRKLAAFGGLCLQFEGGGANKQTDRRDRNVDKKNTQTDRQTNSPLYYIYSYISVHIFIYFYIQ